MLDAAQAGDYAYPAVNVTSITTINAALKAFADAKSDGIIQFSTGGGQFASGLNVKDAAYGCIVLAEAAHRLADKYDVLIGLHTDHCQPETAAGFLKPLIEETARRREAGQSNLFQSHMLDASILPLEENMAISKEYLELCAANDYERDDARTMSGHLLCAVLCSNYAQAFTMRGTLAQSTHGHLLGAAPRTGI